MNPRFEGAITTREDGVLDSSLVPQPERPPRPAMVEAAAAILIVVGVAGIAAQVLAIVGGTAVPSAGAEPILLLQYALIVLTIVIGLLVRAGRSWLLSVNVVAVILFLDLTAVPSGNVFALIFSVLDAIVFVTLIRHRWWFEWRPPAPGPDEAGGEDAATLGSREPS
jgi:hypothetical protein